MTAQPVRVGALRSQPHFPWQRSTFERRCGLRVLASQRGQVRVVWANLLAREAPQFRDRERPDEIEVGQHARQLIDGKGPQLFSFIYVDAVEVGCDEVG